MTSLSRKRTVLIVDDYEPNRVLLQDVLELEGYRVIGAGDGHAALKLLATVRPAAILLDMKMPFMDGHALLAVLKADRHLASIPVVVVTADRNAQPAGVVECIRKPFDIGHLLATVEGCCRSSADEEHPSQPQLAAP